MTGVTTQAGTEVVTESRAVLAHHARSFRLAAAFLPSERHDDAAVLYAFCRLVDDVVDEASSPQAARADVDSLRQELDDRRTPRPMVAQLQRVFVDRGVPRQAAHELIDGVESDLGEVRVADDAGLIVYGYQVAGTVGLMMSAVLGVAERSAWPHAVDLGIAMQITNICRDVREDAERGRVYVPADRLARVGVSHEQILDGTADRAAVASVVRDLIDLADRYYASADAGMRFIPMRSRVAILVASRVYRAIGHRLRALGGDALAGRTVVPTSHKIVLVAAALWSTVRLSWSAASPHEPILHTALGTRLGANQGEV